MNRKLDSIQVLRGLAAILVVTAHTIRELERQYYRDGVEFISLDKFATFGAVGVDIFFVISGFIMMLVADRYRNKGDEGRKEFLLKRIIRVVPLYWIFTILILILLLGKSLLKQHVGGFGDDYDFDVGFLLKSMFFIPAYNHQEKIFPVLGVGWTLMYEVTFYVIFSCLMMKNKLGFYFYMTMLFLLLSITRAIAISDSATFVFYTNPIFFEFLLGCIAYELLNHKRFTSIKKIIFLLVSISSLALIYHNGKFDSGNMDSWRLIYWGIPAFLLFISAVPILNGLSVNKIFTYMGDISYSLYLSHLVISVPILVKLFSFVGILVCIPYPVAIVIVVFVSILMAHYVYKFLEQPITCYLNGKVRY